MSCPNSSATAQYLTWLRRKKGHPRYLGGVALTGHGKSFQTRCKSEISSVITSAM